MEEAINLLDYWETVVRQRKVVALIVGVTTLASIILSLVMPKAYQGQATILPVRGQAAGPSSLMATSQLLGLGGGVLALEKESPSSRLIVILQSRTLAERVIERHGLLDLLRAAGNRTDSDLSRVVEGLRRRVEIGEDKKSHLISIRVTMSNPELAANIANYYVLELVNYINENTLTAAKGNRIFVEHQMERNKRELLESGKDLASFYGSNRISNVVPTVDVNVSSEDEAKGLDETAETNIRRSKLVQDVPQQVYLQYLLTRRELVNQLNILLSQQYEMAKIEEAKEGLDFQVIDWASVPLNRFKPKRRQIVLVSLIASVFLSLFFVLFREHLRGTTRGSVK